MFCFGFFPSLESAALCWQNRAKHLTKVAPLNFFKATSFIHGLKQKLTIPSCLAGRKVFTGDLCGHGIKA